MVQDLGQHRVHSDVSVFSVKSTTECDRTCIGFIPFPKETLSGSSTDPSVNLLQGDREGCADELLAERLLLDVEVDEEIAFRNTWEHHLGSEPAIDRRLVLQKLQEQKMAAVERWRNRQRSILSEDEGSVTLNRNSQSPQPTLNSLTYEEYDADVESAFEKQSESVQSRQVPIETSPAPEISARELIAKGYPKYALALESTVRFCVFNIGHITKGEFWRTIATRLTPETLNGVIRVENVSQPNGRKRMDMWVTSQVAPRLKQALYLDAKSRRKGVTISNSFPMRELRGIWTPSKATRHWRIDMYRTWRDRALTPRPPKCLRTTEPRRTIATFNVNGIWNKKPAIELFLQKADIGVIAIQETLIDCNQYELRIPGYEVYQRSKSRNFRGQALAIQNTYTSYEIGKAKNDHYIHVKVIGLTTNAQWHIIATYMPSGGNHRKDRTECYEQIMKVHQSILQKEPDATIIILGDFNTPKEQLQKTIKEEKTGLTILPTRGSPKTFHRDRNYKKWTAIDSIVASPAALMKLRHGKVQREWGAVDCMDSDHFPLIATLRQQVDKIQEVAPVQFRFNTDLIKGHGKKLIFSNRWSLLSVDPITTVDELNAAADQFTDTINIEAINLGIKTAVTGRDYTFDRRLKKQIALMSLAKKEWILACKKNLPEANNLKAKYYKLHKSTKQRVKAKTQAQRAKEATRVTKLFRDQEMKAFHRWESNNAVNGGGRNASKVTPVQDKNGALLTGKKDILKRTNDYYRELLQDDPDKLSRNRQFWTGKAQNRREQPLDCNKPITWRDVIEAGRLMAKGTAPGSDGIPIEVYKTLIKEECHEHCKRNGKEIGDGMYVALPLDQLPEEPCTPMGTQLKRVIDGMWNTSNQPKGWSTVTNVSLHKSGDPTDLLNYRGISLITVGMKIFTVVLSLRISRLAELNELFITEQGGFRDGQEAIAQFIALAEIVRRRRLKDLETWIVFIDFKKAFDKVMHEALFEKMDAMGFRGKFLDIIRNIYTTSAAQTRVGGEFGEPYDMIRGTRQGCPLSPILFLLFINDFLTYVPKGVNIPLVGPAYAGGRERTEEENSKFVEKPCPGLLFADDVAGLTNNENEVHAFLAGVTKWSQDWCMPMGAPKCGVMRIGGTEDEQAALAEKYFEVDGQHVSVVREYKYLGIYITDKLGDKEGSDELAHAKTLAAKVKQATNMRRAFLRDKKYPIALRVAVIISKILSVGCYGGEWIAMCQVRTKLIQTELNVAMKLVLGSSTKSHLHATKPLAIELGIPTIEERTTEMRIRLWQKAPELKTWLKLLADPENKYLSKTKVWTSGTSSGIARLQPRYNARHNRVEERKEIERSILDRRVREIRAADGKYNFIDDPTTAQNREQPMRIRQEAIVAVAARALHRDLYNENVKATIDYISFGFDRTRKYLQSAVYIPALTEGTTWLARMRTGGWWTTKRRFDVLKVRGDNHLTSADKCPCCDTIMRTDIPEFVHILLDCSSWSEQRKLLIRPIIMGFLSSEKLEWEGTMGAANWKLETAVRLLGGCIFDNDYLPLYKSADLNTIMDETRKGAPSPLDRYCAGWGGRGEVHLPGLNAHGYTSVAKFLALVMPQHKAKLFPLGIDTQPKAYQTTECPESPVRRPMPLPRLRINEENNDENNNTNSELGPETVDYPQGRISYANQADALRGMGTRCKHVHLPFKEDILLDMESDEYSVGEAAQCHPECMPQLFRTNEGCRYCKE